MRTSYRFLIFSASLMLGACGTLAEGQTQDVTLHTPGASYAECTLDNGLRYPIKTGETVQIMRSFHAMEVDCYALGNRHKKITISPGPNPWSAANVTTGGTGVAYDAVSMGLYNYPAVITVDFNGVQSSTETPDYMNKDAPNPYEIPIENMGPSMPKGPTGETEYLPRGLEKRDMKSINNPFSAMGASPADATTPAPAIPGPGSKEGQIPPAAAKPSSVPTGKTAEELTRSANPTVFSK